jgi:hypothetical protein
MSEIEAQPKVLTPKLRRYQFSLRALIVFVTLCAVACSWLTVKMQQAKRQQEVVELLRRAGLAVYYDYQLDRNGRPDRTKQWPGPAWMRELMGEDLTATVVRVETRPSMSGGFGGFGVSCTPEIDATLLEILPRLAHLKYLDLSGVPIMDSRLEYLQGLLELEDLRLEHAFINDDGLAHLPPLPRLKKIFIGEGELTDVGIIRLGKVRSLKEIEVFGLFLDAPVISDEALNAVRHSLPACKVSFELAFRNH